jgi:hypothetical protein
VNPDTATTDVFAILAVAQANWPHDPVAGSEAVWTKWGQLLGPFRFEELRATLDSLARTFPRLPPFSVLLREVQARRGATAVRAHSPPARSQLTSFSPQGDPPVSLDSDYVIGPYSAAFAAMNTRGWTVERLVECVRLAVAVDRGDDEAIPGPPATR